MQSDDKLSSILIKPRRCVLVAEDDEAIRATLIELIYSEGYDVDGVEDGEAALVFMRTHPDTRCLILDLMLPKKDGWSVRREMLADPLIAHIPVIVLSATNGCCTGPGPTLRACAYLAKPTDLDIFFETLARCVSPA